MGLYSGFITKRQEFDYQLKINRMMILLIDQLSLHIQLHAIINKQFFDKHFYKLLNEIKELENYKQQPPKFSNLLNPLSLLVDTQSIELNKTIRYSPPRMELDTVYSTKYSENKRTYSTNITKSKLSKPTSINRICRINKFQQKEPYELSEQFLDFQNESQVSGKKTLNTSKIRDQTTYMCSPKSLEDQQLCKQ